MRSRFRARRRKRAEASQELELMPMLNVFVSIIPFLLLSAAFVQLAVIPSNLPSTPSPASAPAAEPTVALAVWIRPDALVVSADGATTSSIPRAAAGAELEAPARDGLVAALQAIVAAHPQQREVRIVAAPSTRYQVVIDVMDASRKAGLPEAALADAAGGAQ